MGRQLSWSLWKIGGAAKWIEKRDIIESTHISLVMRARLADCELLSYWTCMCPCIQGTWYVLSLKSVAYVDPCCIQKILTKQPHVADSA